MLEHGPEMRDRMFVQLMVMPALVFASTAAHPALRDDVPVAEGRQDCLLFAACDFARALRLDRANTQPLEFASTPSADWNNASNRVRLRSSRAPLHNTALHTHHLHNEHTMATTTAIARTGTNPAPVMTNSSILKPEARLRPYKDFLTPALHRRFTNAALVVLAGCWFEATLMSEFHSKIIKAISRADIDLRRNSLLVVVSIRLDWDPHAPPVHTEPLRVHC